MNFQFFLKLYDHFSQNYPNIKQVICLSYVNFLASMLKSLVSLPFIFPICPVQALEVKKNYYADKF